MKVWFTPKAKSDIQSITRNIANDKVKAARNWAEY
jgi:plasmid stabilization system protein ParE